MQLIGQTVKHGAFGKGIVTGLSSDMVQEDFLGSYCQDGIIEAHPNYRLRLPLEYQIPFWPYAAQQPGEKRWGRVVLKYMSNKIGE